MLVTVNWVARQLGAAKESFQLRQFVRPRSPRWHELEHAHRQTQPVCQYCGATTNLQVHHIYPFHLFPERELDPTNLITLCMSKGSECHLMFGHNGRWRDFNLHIADECALHRRFEGVSNG